MVWWIFSTSEPPSAAADMSRPLLSRGGSGAAEQLRGEGDASDASYAVDAADGGAVADAVGRAAAEVEEGRPEQRRLPPALARGAAQLRSSATPRAAADADRQREADGHGHSCGGCQQSAHCTALRTADRVNECEVSSDAACPRAWAEA